MSGRPVGVVGLGRSGRSVANHLLAEGTEVFALDDHPDRPGFDDRTPRQFVTDSGIELYSAIDEAELSALVSSAGELVVSPGVPARHRVFAAAAAAQVPVIGDIELAARRNHHPLVAVTGTNGKTTVTTMIALMLERSGLEAVTAGNIGTPLIDVVTDESLRASVTLVVEVSSFQLALTQAFRPSVGTWLNFSEDHLDWHRDLDDYRRAKARIWANQGPSDTMVANGADGVVMAEARLAEHRERAPRLVTFGPGGEVCVDDGTIWAFGTSVATVDELPRAFPHDIANTLAAVASAISAGASVAGCHEVVASFVGLPHRVELVSEARGVRWYDDSKATTPDAVLAALAGLDSVVLIAGGRNKGLALDRLVEASDHLRSVVAIGEAAGELQAAFAGHRPVATATSMAEAVALAAAGAEPGDAVLLSPGCSSFDWYRSYAERGEDFVRHVRQLTEVA